MGSVTTLHGFGQKLVEKEVNFSQFVELEIKTTEELQKYFLDYAGECDFNKLRKNWSEIREKEYKLAEEQINDGKTVFYCSVNDSNEDIIGLIFLDHGIPSSDNYNIISKCERC